MSQLSLNEFYDLMLLSRDIRRNIVSDYFNEYQLNRYANKLQDIENTLKEIDTESQRYKLFTDTNSYILTDLNYELQELGKDIAFCQKGFEAINQIHESKHDYFFNEVNETIQFLKTIDKPHFITDRDGTINNYCARYQSSIQSAYNAIWLTKFCNTYTKSATILTSAPLSSPGILDVSVSTEKDFIIAGSKGREFLQNGQKYELEIALDQKDMLNKLNTSILEITKLSNFKKFALIGSGLQFKFGQTTLARQDINHSISKPESLKLLREIEQIIHKIDPNRKYFRIEDTGMDIEIMLTVKDSSGIKDFDKGNGIEFINKTLNLQYENSACLVCGDTFSDISMAKELVKTNDNVFTIFVTQNSKLIEELRRSFRKEQLRIVSNPDVLITSFGLLKK
jgi:hypothetical protein